MKKNPISIKDISRATKFSTATISRALNNSDLVKPETKEIIFAASNKMEYYPNRIARSLRTKSTKIIGIIVSDIKNPIYTEIFEIIQKELDYLGFSVILCESEGYPDKEAKYLSLLLEWNVDKIVLSHVINTNIPKKILRRTFDKTIQISRYNPKVSRKGVISDNFGGTYLGTKHLIKLGYKRIAFIGGSLEINTGRDRRKGFCQALKDEGLEINEKLISSGPFKKERGYSITKKLIRLKNYPEAIFSSSNFLSIGSLLALKEENKSVPNDIGFISFDDFYTSEFLNSPLTVVRQKINDLAKNAVKLILSESSDNEIIITIPTELIVRESCGYKLRIIK